MVAALAAWPGVANASGKKASTRAATVEQLVAAARKEHGLTIYGLQATPLLQAFVSAFDKQYKLSGGKFVRLLPGPQEQRFLEEARAHHDVADVLLNVDVHFLRANSKLFTAMGPTVIPGFQSIPAAAKGPDWVVAADVPSGIAYNTHLVPPSEVPRTWRQVTNKVFDGRAVIVDPRSSPQYADLFEVLGQRLGQGYLASIKASNYSLQQSGADAIASIASGADAINYPTVPVFVNILPKGAPVKFVIPAGQTFVTPIEAAIPASAPDPAQARLFAYWIQSKSGQAVGCQPQWGQAVPPGFAQVPGCLKQSAHPLLTDFGLTSSQDRALFSALGLP